MIDAADLPRLLQQLESESVASFECDGPEGFRLRIRFEPRTGEHQPPAPAPASVGQEPVSAKSSPAPVLRSPGIGLLRLRHPLSHEPLMRDGGPANEGDLLALLHMGEVLTPISCDRSAVVVRSLVAEGALVGYGELLFELR
jgi:biotin carboxyl carrier protein